jgi:cutinase
VHQYTPGHPSDQVDRPRGGSLATPVELVRQGGGSERACPTTEVVFARGTGEPDGIGRVGQAFVDSLRQRLGDRSLTVQAVDYPASRDFLRAVDGANEASSVVQQIAATCPTTKIVLGGYSQGAAVIDLITVFDQPAFGFTNIMPAEVADHGGDPVCSNGSDVPAHSLYGEAGLPAQAAEFTAKQLATPTSAATLRQTSGDAEPGN